MSQELNFKSTPREGMVFTHALVRKPAANFSDGLTTSLLGKPSYTLIKKQHDAYVAALESLGLGVTVAWTPGPSIRMLILWKIRPW